MRSRWSASAIPPRAAPRPARVVDLAAAEECDPPSRRLRRAHGRRCEIESVVLSISAGRLASELFAAEVSIEGSDGDRSATSSACSPPAASIRCARAAPCCIRCRSAIRSTAATASAIRAACSAAASASTCTWRPRTSPSARNLMLAVERCHLDVEAMVASPYVAGLSVLADDEGDLGAAGDRHGRRHDHASRCSRRPFRSCRRFRARRPPRHAWTSRAG